MANNGAAHKSPSEPIGRVRLDDSPAASQIDAAAPGEPDDNGWTVAGVGLAVLLAILMIGALIIILWATFQARA